MAWGENAFGELGDGTEGAPSDVPVAVSGLSAATAIAAGENHSVALLGDRTVVQWGSQNHGLSSGDPRPGETRDVPAPVSGLSGVMSIAGGEEHSLALLGNGTVMAWGENGWGQLGDGASTQDEIIEAPVRVNNLGGVTAIAAGGSHSLAVSALPGVTGVQPNAGPFTGGTSVSVTGRTSRARRRSGSARRTPSAFA